MKFKYLLINIIGLMFVLAMFGIYIAYGGTLDTIPMKLITFMSLAILVFFASVAIADTAKNKEISKYGKTTGYMFWIVGLGIAIYGIIKIFIWRETGTIETYSTTGDLNYYTWKDDYIYILLEWALYSIILFITGIIARVHISIISWVTKKIVCRKEVGSERV